MASKTRFGFQLFSVALHKATARAIEDFTSAKLAADQPSFPDSLRSALDSLVGKTRSGELKYRFTEDESDAEEGDTKPAIRVIKAEFASHNRIDFEFRYGRIGSHDSAIAPDEADDAELTDKAPTNIYRASLYLPTGGVKAILMVENRANQCPVDYFLKHLSFHFQDIDEERPGGAKVGWWRLMARGVTDTERLGEVLRQGKGAALQLAKLAPTTDGGRRPSEVVLRQDGLPPSRIEQVKAMVLDWMDLHDPDMEDVEFPRGTSVEQVAALIDVHVRVDEFNDGAVVYDDGTGRTQTIRPHSTRDVFIYPVSMGRVPTPSEIRVLAEERIRRLMGLLQVQITI